MSMFRERPKRVSVFIPESPLLDSLRRESKFQLDNYSQHMEKARDNLEHFTTTRFWEKDVGYKFVERKFIPLLKSKCHVVELGCSVGPLPEYLKRINVWGDFTYYGYDVNQCSIKLAQEHYPEGNFSVADLQEEVLLGLDNVDIAFEKGTIISSSYPYRVLENILKLQAKYIVMIHCPILMSSVDEACKYISLVNVSENNAYLISVMDKSYFMELLTNYGYKVAVWEARREKHKIVNHDAYQLVDMLISR